MTTLTRPGGFARQRIDTAVHAVANEETRAACRASWSSTQQHCGPGGQIRTGREWNARVNACTVTDGHDYKETRHGHADMTTAPPSCGPDSTCRECSEQRTPRRMLPETYSHRHSGRVLWTVHCPDRGTATGRIGTEPGVRRTILCGHPLTGGVGRFPNLAGGPAGPATRETLHCCRGA
jgi:hypothetical protein